MLTTENFEFEENSEEIKEMPLYIYLVIFAFVTKRVFKYIKLF